MDTLINEALMLISTAVILPVALVLTWAYATGRLMRTENARYTPVLEDDVDYWDTSNPRDLPRVSSAARSATRGGAGV